MISGTTSRPVMCWRTGTTQNNEGVFINSVIPPACAPQDTLIRFSLMATHTRAQVDRAVEALTKVFKEEGIIK